MTPEVCFIAFGSRALAGSRLRAWAVADAWPESDCVPWREDWPDTYDAPVVVLQKVHPRPKADVGMHLLEQVRAAQARGQLVIWDLCDPIWWWMSESDFLGLARAMDGLTVSTDGLQTDLWNAFQLQSFYIADRQPFTTMQRRHAKVPVPQLVWFGYAQNRIPCFSSGALALDRLLHNHVPFTLKIVDDRPEWRLSVASELASITTYEKWSLSTIEATLASADVAFLPPYPGPWGPMKGDDKIMTAAWAGLPSADGTDYPDLARLLTDWEYRAMRGRQARMWAELEREIHQSVEEWKQVIHAIQAQKEGYARSTV